MTERREGFLPPIDRLGDTTRIEETEEDLEWVTFGARFIEPARRVAEGRDHPDYDPLTGWLPLTATLATDTREELEDAL